MTGAGAATQARLTAVDQCPGFYCLDAWSGDCRVRVMLTDRDLDRLQASIRDARAASARLRG